MSIYESVVPFVLLLLASTVSRTTAIILGTKLSSNPNRVTNFFLHSVPAGGASGVVVIVVGNGDGDTSSNPGRD